MREALIDQRVLAIVLGQARDDVKIADVQSLRRRLASRLQNKHGLRNQSSSQDESEES